MYIHDDMSEAEVEAVRAKHALIKKIDSIQVELSLAKLNLTSGHPDLAYRTLSEQQGNLQMLTNTLRDLL